MRVPKRVRPQASDRDREFSSKTTRRRPQSSVKCRSRTRRVLVAYTTSRRNTFSRTAYLAASKQSIWPPQRAKTLLIQHNGISEEEAYQQIRSQAMERRISINQLAEQIVHAHALLKR
ncbi:ANTAR domain-containing protein [Burkholderia sp. IMCC1007]|uniref:ANTAR domain-containing protein n=1 Tax=Burkholderia sp. IMCC1007 TaxID=3004104 RepID=UPI002F968A28